MLRVLYVANGHGETAIAARIASEVGRLARGPVAQDLLPLVGTGAGAEPLAVVGRGARCRAEASSRWATSARSRATCWPASRGC